MKIGVITNSKKDYDFRCFNDTIDFLAGKCEVYTDISCAGNVQNKASVIFLETEELYNTVGYLVLIGGDGTFLRVADAVSKKKIKVLGINLGKVGYITEIETNQLDLLDRIITGDFKVENRMMITADVIRQGEKVKTFNVLNDIVIAHGLISRMINLDLFYGGKHITNYRADGVIISTPTGSTAYSLSAGGPIIDPKLETITVTPICSHSTSSRPIIFGTDYEISVKITEGDAVVFLTADGYENFKLLPNDEVLIKKSVNNVSLIRFTDDSFYRTFKNKLN